MQTKIGSRGACQERLSLLDVMEHNALDKSQRRKRINVAAPNHQDLRFSSVGLVILQIHHFKQLKYPAGQKGIASVTIKLMYSQIPAYHSGSKKLSYRRGIPVNHMKFFLGCQVDNLESLHELCFFHSVDVEIQASTIQAHPAQLTISRRKNKDKSNDILLPKLLHIDCLAQTYCKNKTDTPY